MDIDARNRNGLNLVVKCDLDMRDSPNKYLRNFLNLSYCVTDQLATHELTGSQIWLCQGKVCVSNRKAELR